MRDRRCPVCHHWIHTNHRCRATQPSDPPTPFNRQEFERMMTEAREEARAQAAADAQAELPLTLPIEVEQ